MSDVRLINATKFDVFDTIIPEQYDTESFMAGMDCVLDAIHNAPTIEIPHSEDWARYSDALWKIAYERGKDEAVQGIADEMIRQGLHIASNEPKQGDWIETEEGTMCSVCNKYPYDDGEYHIANWRSDFCPKCGADMRERKDNEID